MDFDLTEDQRLLKESVDRLVADQYGFAQRKTYATEATGWSAKMWGQFAEMGLLGLPFAETVGGFGGGPVETMIVMETFGRGLVLVAGREIPDYASAAAYNPLDLRDPVPIYARNRQAASDSAVIAAFADRPVWFLDGPSITGGGYVVQAGPLSAADALRRVATEHDAP